MLVGEDYVLKVADFGLARDIYKDEHYVKTTSVRMIIHWWARGGEGRELRVNVECMGSLFKLYEKFTETKASSPRQTPPPQIDSLGVPFFASFPSSTSLLMFVFRSL